MVSEQAADRRLQRFLTAYNICNNFYNKLIGIKSDPPANTKMRFTDRAEKV